MTDEKTTSLSESTYGKFRNADELWKAYGNLEREFTKKCQTLKDYEQRFCDNSDEPQKIYERQDWRARVDNFLKQNPDATAFASEIAERLVDNPELAKNECALELAYLNVLKSNFRSPDALIRDDSFLNEYVYANETIRKRILRDYIDELSRTTFRTVTGGRAVVTPPHKPKTIEEASRIAKEYLK